MDWLEEDENIGNSKQHIAAIGTQNYIQLFDPIKTNKLDIKKQIHTSNPSVSLKFLNFDELNAVASKNNNKEYDLAINDLKNIVYKNIYNNDGCGCMSFVDVD